jgi:site-specific DNA-methyltransferase (adenine-specific)
MRPYYDDGTCVIYHGDCRDVLPSIRASAVITDPPYGTNVTSWDQSVDAEVLRACAGATDGYAAFFYSNTRLWHILSALKSGDFDTWTAVWHKSNSVGFERKFAPQWTPIVIAYRKPQKFWGQDLCYCPITVQDIGHPTPKPIGVTTWLMEKVSSPGESVLDPFMGSGTTLVVAKRLGRKALGIEVEEKYCEIAAERLQQGVLDLFSDPNGCQSRLPVAPLLENLECPLGS